MQVLLAVVEDLYTFAVSTLFGWHREEAPRSLYLERTAHKQLPAADRRETPVIVPQKQESAQPHGDAAVQRAPISVHDGVLPQKNTIVYAARTHVPLKTIPEDAADTTVETLAYGDMVMMLEAGEEWSFVAVRDKKGYVRTAELARHAGAVYPEFVVGGENGPRDTNTVRLRFVIRDEFSASGSHIPLQAHEYVHYKLVRRGVQIAWPDIRPRTPGTWTRILSSLATVTVSAEPRVGAVMECALAEDRAHLAYVEKVHDDGSIQLSEANWPDRGIYNERRLSRDEWHDLAPTFIVIS